MSEVRIVIGLIAGVALAVLVANFVIRGVDAPQGLLYLLGLIIGAVFGPAWLEKTKGGKNGKSD
jgi:hypothetical protein